MDKVIYALVYFICMNIISFIVFYFDKEKSENGKWRIQEKTLHTLSFLGGAIGSIIAMKVFHHKTKKTSFIVVTVLALIFNLFLYYMVYKYLLIPIL